MKNKPFSSPVSAGYKRALTLVVMLLAMASAVAHDFEVKNGDGKTIYYSIDDQSHVSVDHANGPYPSYSGDVVIPETVVYDGKCSTCSATAPADFDPDAADFDGDGKPTITDITAIIQKILEE